MRTRNQSGKFSMKGDQPRHVRSIRLTDSCWEKLNHLADSKNMSIADYLEKFVNSNDEKFDSSEIKQLLESALGLPANKGGAIKAIIKNVLSSM